VKVLFLDIDGVLNGHQQFKHMPYCKISRPCVRELNRVLVKTGCKVVLSSAWRYMVLNGSMTLRGFEYMLKTHGLGGLSEVIVGSTVADEVEASRERQILGWVKSQHERLLIQKPRRWAVVDDLDLAFPARDRWRFVQTDGTRGLTRADGDRLIEILNAE
jgi:hypothetical protein